MKEIAIISGKGGTGKTSVTACFAVLNQNSVFADCDVDAADLSLILTPTILKKEEFKAGKVASIRQEECIQCGQCFEKCRFQAIEKKSTEKGWTFSVDPLSCEGCGVCGYVCPSKCIDFSECVCGEWMISQTRCGHLVHAQLGVAAENSGKLVSLVRQEAKKIAQEKNADYIFLDGPPGIGCPVIASITGVSLVLVVTEPTVSGEHDFQRVLSLANHFGIPSFFCVNKWDINKEMTEKMEKLALQAGAKIAGRIRYDENFVKAQLKNLSIVEMDTVSKADVLNIWNTISKTLS